MVSEKWLKSLTLHGFKSIRELKDLRLGPLNVLIGANGAGKSNLLSFFRMLNAAMAGGLQSFVRTQGGANALLHHGRKRTQQISASMEFDVDGGTNTYAFSLEGVPPDNLVFKEEVVSHTPQGGRARENNLGGGHSESLLRSMVPEDTTVKTVKWNLDRWRFYHFHDTSAAAPIKQTATLHDNRFLRADGANLPAFLYMLRERHPAHYERIRDTVRMVAPFFDDFILEPSELNPNVIQLEWRELGSDTAFFAHHLSDGTLRFIALTTLLLQPTALRNLPRLVVIDEPELGLHPYAITLLASMLRTASNHFQIVVSTQSVSLLDELDDPSSVVVVERDGGQSSFRRLDPAALEDWLEEYSLGELWMKNVLGGRPRRSRS